MWIGKIDLTNFYEAGEENVKDCIRNSFSYSTDDTFQLCELVFQVIRPKNIDAIHLISYPDLPKDSSSIKVETLLTNDHNNNELVSYFNSKNDPIDEEGVLDSLLRIIRNVYNEY